jgi:hypothetical protein
MISPVGKPCVYYHVRAEEQVTVRNGDKTETRWEFRFEESQSLDFFLGDPDTPDIKVYVPGSRSNIKRASSSIQASTGAGAASFFQSENIAPGIQELLNRHNFKVETNVLIGVMKKKMRYIEQSYDVDEQIALLGIVQDGLCPDGSNLRVIEQVSIIVYVP